MIRLASAVLLLFLADLALCGMTSRHGLDITVTEDRRLALFAVDSNRFVRHAIEKRINTAEFTEWEDLGNIATSAPASGLMHNKFLAVFVKDEENGVSVKYAVPPPPETPGDDHTKVNKGPGWSVWTSLGSKVKVMLEPVTLQRGQSEPLEVFAVGVDLHLYHSIELTGKAREAAIAAGKAPFTPWHMLSHQTFSGNPSITEDASGRLRMFIRGSDNFVYTARESTSRGVWHKLASDASLRVLGDPKAVVHADRRIEVFVRGADNAVYHRWQVSARNVHRFSGWRTMEGLTTGNPAAVQTWDRRLEVFTRGSDNAVWAKEFGWDNGWGTWGTLGGKFVGSPRVAKFSDGRLILFGVARDTTIWYRTQTVIPAANWKDWKQLGGDVFS